MFKHQRDYEKARKDVREYWRALKPGITEEELNQAEYKFKTYVECCIGIAEDLDADPERKALFKKWCGERERLRKSTKKQVDS